MLRHARHFASFVTRSYLRNGFACVVCIVCVLCVPSQGFPRHPTTATTTTTTLATAPRHSAERTRFKPALASIVVVVGRRRCSADVVAAGSVPSLLPSSMTVPTSYSAYSAQPHEQQQQQAMAGGLRSAATLPPSYRPPPTTSTTTTTASASFQRRNSLDPVWEDMDHYYQQQHHYQQQQQAAYEQAVYTHWSYGPTSSSAYGGTSASSSLSSSSSYLPPSQPLPHPHSHLQQQQQPPPPPPPQQHYRNSRRSSTSSTSHSSSSNPPLSTSSTVSSRTIVPSYPTRSSTTATAPPPPPGYLRGRTHSLPAIHQPHLVTTSNRSMHGYDPMNGIPSSSASSSSSSSYNTSAGVCACPNASMAGCLGGCFNSRGPSMSSAMSSGAYDPMSSGAYDPLPSVPLTSMPAPTLPAVTDVTYQDDYHWERLALNSASSLPAPVPSSYQPASHFPPSAYYPEFGPIPTSGLTRVSHESLFMTNNPQSDRLAEFVSKMVFVIFWHGSEAFDKILHALKHRSRGSVGEIILEQVNLGATTAYQATPEFVKYTKYLLQTMQISCSTALLSLFYLHRLRPRVQHMFVPGTFVSNASAAEKQRDGASHRYQYRRDPKLEYRLFTISVILANKYLDDNSYSNKAWSDVTGLELRKINIMEQEFMKYIDYSLVVVRNEYSAWVNWLETYIGPVMPAAGKQFSFEPIPTNSILFKQRRGSLPVTPVFYPKSSTNSYGNRFAEVSFPLTIVIHSLQEKTVVVPTCLHRAPFAGQKRAAIHAGTV